MKENENASLIIPELIENQNEFRIIQKDVLHGWKWNFEELVIPKGRPRVVLLGESVASGYFYRPQSTLGKILDDALPEYEVVDLSRIDLHFSDLPKLRQLVEGLRPDKIILFAGNNNSNFFFYPSVTDYVQESIGWILDLEGKGISVKVIIPGFNYLQWKPQEIKTTITKEFELIKACENKKDLSKDELHKLKEMASDGCPTSGYILGRHYHPSDKKQGQLFFETSLLSYLSIEHISPRITPVIRDELIRSCQNKNISYLDVADLGLEEAYLDYCHLSMPGLVKLVENLFPGTTLKVPDVDQVRVLKKVFFHSYGYGQFDYCLHVLNDLKRAMSSNDFIKFMTVFYQALFIESTANFVEDYIAQSPHFFESEAYLVRQQIPNNFQLILPSKKFHDFLRAQLPVVPVLAKPARRLDLLAGRRCYISKRHVIDRIYRSPYLQFRQYDLEFRSYFHQSEIETKEEINLAGLLELNSDDFGIEVYLNGKSVSDILTGNEIDLKLAIPTELLESYNELKILLHSKKSIPLEKVREEGLFQFHKLSINPRI